MFDRSYLVIVTLPIKSMLPFRIGFKGIILNHFITVVELCESYSLEWQKKEHLCGLFDIFSLIPPVHQYMLKPTFLLNSEKEKVTQVAL